jgi:putative ATPase
MINNKEPLSARLRPTSIADIVGQQHLLGDGAPLQLLAAQKKLVSMILWGPPGVGKTTIARILAAEANLPIVQLSAIDSNVKEVRNAIEQAKSEGQLVLFLDEIHRFNKAQQDSLLRAVEEGSIILIGATTENPSFEVINALLSRCQVYVLQSIGPDDLLQLLHKAIAADAALVQRQIVLVETDALIVHAAGDARKLLNILDIIAQATTETPLLITNKMVVQLLQQNILQFDKAGDWHYDVISAFIKSMRGSDPNAALYWLARMIHAGEDPMFIARRMLIFASEDIGNANPNALLIANQCYTAVHHIGYPECRIILGQTVTYLATSAKSNSTYMAIEAALALVKSTGNLPVPLHLRNAPTNLLKQLSHGDGYIYPHNEAGNFAIQQYMPAGLEGTILYQPAQNAQEAKVLQQLRQWWASYYTY